MDQTRVMRASVVEEASPGPAAAYALELPSASRRFGGLRAVDDVALAGRAGERRALIGPNGAGKTTLFNLISGELSASAGSITLFGRDVTRAAAHRRAALGLARTFQITNVFPSLTVLENCLLAVQALSPVKLAMHRSLGRYPVLHTHARATLEAVGLADRAGAVVKHLSHGEQRQLEIALALAGRPRVLLLDEPTAGLSPAESQMMAGLIKDDAITRWPPYRMVERGMALVPQGRRVFASLTVRENLEVARHGQRGRWTLPRVLELFPRLGDRVQNRANKLSGGEQQMLAIGRALMTDPDLLLMDEPTEGLAPLLVREVGRGIAELKREGLSILR